MDGSNNLKESKIHLEINNQYGDGRIARKMHKIARDCMKEGKSFVRFKTMNLLTLELRGVFCYIEILHTVCKKCKRYFTFHTF